MRYYNCNGFNISINVSKLDNYSYKCMRRLCKVTSDEGIIHAIQMQGIMPTIDPRYHTTMRLREAIKLIHPSAKLDDE